VWRDNNRRHAHVIPTHEVMRTYGADYKLIFVGDASMSPYEIVYPGGSVEHMNAESGQVWMDRLTNVYGHAVWLNPVREAWWGHTQSVGMVKQLMSDRMYPLTLGGLDAAIRELSH